MGLLFPIASAMSPILMSFLTTCFCAILRTGGFMSAAQRGPARRTARLLRVRRGFQPSYRRNTSHSWLSFQTHLQERKKERKKCGMIVVMVEVVRKQQGTNVRCPLVVVLERDLKRLVDQTVVLKCFDTMFGVFSTEIHFCTVWM